jgi:hypothetical protein
LSHGYALIGDYQEAAVQQMMLRGQCFLFLKTHPNDPRRGFVFEKYINSFFNKFMSPKRELSKVLPRLQEIIEASSFSHKTSLLLLTYMGSVST